MSTDRGGARATIRDVAAEAGVSKALVSLAFKDASRVSPLRRDRILAAAEKLGYQPNFVARSLATEASSFIGILMGNLHNPLFAEIADAARVTFDEHGRYGLIASATKPSAGGALRVVDTQVMTMFRDLRPLGVLVVGTIPDATVLSGLPASTPIVYASALPPDESAYPSVRADDEAGMALLFDHLIGRGHRRIGFVGGEGGAVSTRRLVAYRRAAGRQGIREEIFTADYSEESGYAAGRRVVAQQDRPDALIAVNDMAALGVVAAVEHAGLHVPEAMAVAGFDNTFVAGLHRIGLTSVDTRNADVGRGAAMLLLAQLAGEEPPGGRLVIPRLVVRDST